MKLSCDCVFVQKIVNGDDGCDNGVVSGSDRVGFLPVVILESGNIFAGN